jgi:uncharacterized protein
LIVLMPDLAIGRLGCFRCAYVWSPARKNRPQVCPRCKSRLWDVPRLRAISHGRGSGIAELLLPNRQRILSIVRNHGFDHVRVFGSVRRGEATKDSDIDLLVAPGPDASLLDRAALGCDLEELLGRKVDVVTDGGLHWLIRPQVLFEAAAL